MSHPQPITVNSEIETIRTKLANPQCWKLNVTEARWLLKEFEYVSRTAKEMAHEAVILRLENSELKRRLAEPANDPN